MPLELRWPCGSELTFWLLEVWDVAPLSDHTPQLAVRVVTLDSCQDVFARRCMPMLMFDVGDQCVRELVSTVA